MQNVILSRHNYKNSGYFATKIFIWFYELLAASNDGVLRGKFLLAARRFRRAKCTDYIISLSAEDISEESSSYMGKLRQVDLE